jgi:hypothetical protein
MAEAASSATPIQASIIWASDTSILPRVACISADPLAGEGQRRYEYADADPVDEMDPTGNAAMVEFLLDGCPTSDRTTTIGCCQVGPSSLTSSTTKREGISLPFD